MSETVLNKLKRLIEVQGLDFSIDTDFQLDADVLDFGTRTSQKFLGDYSKTDIHRILKSKGIFAIIINQTGCTELLVRMDVSDPFVHRLCIVGKAPPVPRPPQPNGSSSDLASTVNLDDIAIEFGPPTNAEIPLLFMDMMIRRSRFQLHDMRKALSKLSSNTGHPHPGASEASGFMTSHLNFELDIAMIEWLCLQNPFTTFTKLKPQLPGQKYPGLGAGRLIQQTLIELAMTKRRDGLLNIPEYFHNAVLYTAYRFIDPTFQAFFNSILNDLQADITSKNLAAVSYAICMGCLRNRQTGEIIQWDPEEQILPLSERMKHYFENPDYTSMCERYTTSGVYYIDWDAALKETCVRQALGVVAPSCDVSFISSSDASSIGERTASVEIRE